MFRRFPYSYFSGSFSCIGAVVAAFLSVWVGFGCVTPTSPAIDKSVDSYALCKAVVDENRFSAGRLASVVQGGADTGFDRQALGESLGSLFGVSSRFQVTPVLERRDTHLDVVIDVPAGESTWSAGDAGRFWILVRYSTNHCVYEDGCSEIRTTGHWSVLGFHHDGDRVQRVRTCSSALPGQVFHVNAGDERLGAFDSLDAETVRILQEVHVRGVNFRDVHFLSGFVGLEKVTVDTNPRDAKGAFRDLSFVQGLPHLKQLHVIRQEVKDLTPLLALAPLEVKKPGDFSPSLERLSLVENEVDEIPVLRSLTRLTHLDLEANLIRSSYNALAALSGLTNLEELSLARNQIDKVDELATLTELRVLNLSGNGLGREHRIVDATPLQGMTKLTDLNLYQAKLESFDPLVGTLGADVPANTEVTLHLNTFLYSSSAIEVFKRESANFLKERFKGRTPPRVVVTNR